ncbi:MAG: PQQ-binding-like beta-propeller repeat protein [Planctomycetota bacterium]
MYSTTKNLTILAIQWVSLVLFVSLSQYANAQWSEFRGPQGSGITSGSSFPVNITTDDIEWNIDIHGKGWSSPVVVGNQVWLTTATEDGKQMSVICVALDSGKVLLDRVLHENETPDFCHPTNSYASPTPVVEEGHAYIHFGKYGTTCLDTKTFETVWQRLDLECDHFRGPGSSPILFEDLMIVAFDGADRQYVVALDKRSGKTVWTRDRDIKYGTDNGDFKKAYGTGSIVNVNDQPLLIYPAAVATNAYQPKTGDPVWTLYHGGMNVSSRPLMTPEGNVLISNGMGKLFAVDPSGKGDITESNIRWQSGKAISRKPSPLVIDDRFYMLNDKGILSCCRTKDGQSIWQQRIGNAYSSSPVFDGESIFVCSENGIVYAFAHSDKFKQLGKSKLAEGFKATPAIAGPRMVFRSFSKLFCVKATSRQSTTDQ